MTTDAISENQVPQSCTLPTVELPQGVAEFEALYALALRSQQRMTPTWLRMVLDPRAERWARDLTRPGERMLLVSASPSATHRVSCTLMCMSPAYIDLLDAVAVQANAAAAAAGPIAYVAVA